MICALGHCCRGASSSHLGAIMPERKERTILEAFLETSEVIVDALTDDNVLAGVPVIGSAFKIARAADSIRDRAFAAKLARFADGLGTISVHEKEQYVRKLKSNPEEAARVGETLVLVLDRFIDLEKPELLARVFVGYLEGNLSASEFHRLSQAIDSAFTEDINALLSAGTLPEKPTYPWMESLVPHGLTQAVIVSTVDIAAVYYTISTLGHKLREVWSLWNNKMADR